VAALFDAAYDEYFSGRIGVDDWLRPTRARSRQRARRLVLGACVGRHRVALRIGTTMLRALPPSLHVERMALADACEAGIDPALPEPLQLKAWIELSCVLADSQKARGRRAAEQALALARRLDAQQPDRFVLHHALCRAASAAAQASDLPAAGALLEESQRLEDPSWPAQRLLWGTEAAQWFARMSGDTADALRRGRRLLALDRERGSHAALPPGNLIDAELAAGDARAAAAWGASSSSRCSARATSTAWRSRASTCSRRCWRRTTWRRPARSRRPRGRRPACSTAARGRRLPGAVLRARRPAARRAEAGGLLRGDLRGACRSARAQRNRGDAARAGAARSALRRRRVCARAGRGRAPARRRRASRRIRHRRRTLNLLRRRELNSA
jgi:hypothetical protein